LKEEKNTAKERKKIFAPDAGRKRGKTVSLVTVMSVVNTTGITTETLPRIPKRPEEANMLCEKRNSAVPVVEYSLEKGLKKLYVRNVWINSICIIPAKKDQEN
jgi:hypothetical protein